MPDGSATSNEPIDGLLKTWMLAVVVLGGGAFAVQLLKPKLAASFIAAGTGLPLLTQMVLVSLAYVWLLPVLALAGYLLRRRQAGSAQMHVVGVKSLLVIAVGWLLIAICGLLLPVL